MQHRVSSRCSWCLTRLSYNTSVFVTDLDGGIRCSFQQSRILPACQSTCLERCTWIASNYLTEPSCNSFSE